MSLAGKTRSSVSEANLESRDEEERVQSFIFSSLELKAAELSFSWREINPMPKADRLSIGSKTPFCPGIFAPSTSSTASVAFCARSISRAFCPACVPEKRSSLSTCTVYQIHLEILYAQSRILHSAPPVTFVRFQLRSGAAACDFFLASRDWIGVYVPSETDHANILLCPITDHSLANHLLIG